MSTPCVISPGIGHAVAAMGSASAPQGSAAWLQALLRDCLDCLNVQGQQLALESVCMLLPALLLACRDARVADTATVKRVLQALNTTVQAQHLPGLLNLCKPSHR